MATYYISPIGNDSSGAGTQVSPWQTISKAVSSSTTGDTILCDSANGNNTFASQVFGSARTINSYGGGTAVFDGGASQVRWRADGNLSISNLKFQNALGGANSAGIFDCNGGNFTYSNCIFSGLQGGGAFSFSIFTANFSTGNHSYSTCLLQNLSKLVSAPSTDAVWFANNTMNVTLTDCTLYSNISSSDTPGLLECIFGHMGTVTLTNSIFYNANGSSVFFSENGPPTYAGSNNDILGYSTTPSLPNQLSTDPLFVDAANSNFNLRPTSPCIAAGTAL